MTHWFIIVLLVAAVGFVAFGIPYMQQAKPSPIPANLPLKYLELQTTENATMLLIDPGHKRTGIYRIADYNLPWFTNRVTQIASSDYEFFCSFNQSTGRRDLCRNNLTISQPTPGKYDLLIFGIKDGSYSLSMTINSGNPAFQNTGVIVRGQQIRYQLLIPTTTLPTLYSQ